MENQQPTLIDKSGAAARDHEGAKDLFGIYGESCVQNFVLIKKRYSLLNVYTILAF